MSDKYRKYFGKRFYKQKHDDYWMNWMPIQAHRWVWICHYGMIPAGMDIHHIDGDKDNNEIENLVMLSRSDHLKEHWKDPELRKERRKQLDAIRPKVHAYLRTPEGREKQRQGALKSAKYRKIFILNCECCGKEIKTKQPWAKFCSSACTVKTKRKSGKYNIEAKCSMCDKIYLKDKFTKRKFCSISCGAKNSAANRGKLKK